MILSKCFETYVFFIFYDDLHTHWLPSIVLLWKFKFKFNSNLSLPHWFVKRIKECSGSIDRMTNTSESKIMNCCYSMAKTPSILIHSEISYGVPNLIELRLGKHDITYAFSVIRERNAQCNFFLNLTCSKWEMNSLGIFSGYSHQRVWMFDPPYFFQMFICHFL